MADAITIKALQDASLDAKSLEDVVNGDEAKQVTTRLGENYPSVKKAIKTLFENGGLPAETFATKAKMETDGASLADGQLAQVYNEAVNNGLYVKTAGVWVKAPYDPVGQSKDYADQLTTELRRWTTSNLGADTHVFADVDGNIVAKINADGGLFLTGLDASVQEAVTKADSSSLLYKEKSAERAHALTDLNGEVLFDLYDDGSAHFIGLDNDLATEINLLKDRAGSTDVIKETGLAATRSYKDTFTQAGQSLLNNLFYGQTGAKAPPPMDLFPQNFTMNKTWVSNLLPISHATSTRLVVDTPYHTDGGVVHPSIIEFYNGFRGYRYLICITPYQLTNEAEENPCIYGSNDLINLVLLDGFTQPLDNRPQPAFSTGHNSDNVFTYDPKTGELICVWRQSLRDPLGDGVRTDALWMRKTKDGYTWSDKERIFLSAKNTEGGAAGSPAILYDAKTDYWYMYLTRLGVSKTAMRLFRAKKLNEDAWEYVSTLTLPFDAWHQEVKFVGDKIVMLVYEYSPNDAIYVGVADNFTDFSWSGNILAEDNGYKASFVPAFDANNRIALRILYTTNASPASDSEKWRMYSTTTNFIDAGVTAI